jgi:hypothetical protein
MTAGLRTLLAGIVDYAGLFPPAGLPLETALRNYVRHGDEPDAWMLGRFVIPAARLEELAPLAGLFPPTSTLTFSALGRGGAARAEFLAGLAEDMRAIESFQERHGRGVRVDAFEVRLPADAFAPGADLPRLLDEAARPLEDACTACLPVYFEAPADDAARTAVALEGRRNRGFKVRCGGLKAGDFPAAADVAGALTACIDSGVPFKATAGLHHALPRFDEGVQARTHGFVNLAVAGVLSCALGLDAEQVRVILEDDRPDGFGFDDGGVRWRDHRATVAEVAAARRDAVVSFGSCSFDEPREDLRKLGWL